MAEQEQAPSTEQATSTQPDALEQVYKEFKVDEVAQNFQPQRQQQQAQPPQQQTQSGDVPDPVLNPEGYKAWNRQQAESLRTTAARSEQVATALLQKLENADIRNAASEFVKAAGVDGVDEDMAEVQLGVLARKDPRFASLWNNRESNPRAWRAAVTAAGKQFGSKFQFKTDPQIAENVRAAKQSTQTSPTTKQEQSGNNPLEQRLNEAAKNGSFEREWQRIVNSNVM